MKKLLVLVFVFCSFMSIRAQHNVNFLFDDKGTMRTETVELSQDSVIIVNHRSDDVVWSRVVYRIIDMRYKQNYQLYYPILNDNEYRSLFKVILEGIADDEKPLPVYSKALNPSDGIRPSFLDEDRVPLSGISNLLESLEEGEASAADRNERRVLRIDSIENFAGDSIIDLVFVQKNFERVAKNQLKYVIQEVVFFDKHYSRLYSKIMAIAPLRADMQPMTPDMPIMEALYGQLLFWIPFDALRPYMAQQYVMPKASDKTRVTFDEFFAKKLYTSYILGVSNMHNNRMIPGYVTTREEIKAEQDRIERELLDFELDLWEY